MQETTTLILGNALLLLNDIKGVSEFKEKIQGESFSSPSLLDFVHQKRHGCSPPKVVYTLYAELVEGELLPNSTIPWRIEFSFLPQRFFQEVTGKVYFLYGKAFSYAAENKDRWTVDFLKSIFINLYHIKYDIMKPHGRQLTLEEIEYIGEHYDGDSTFLDCYIDNLADYGDFDYFQKALKERGIEPSKEHIKRFSRRVIAYGRDNLLEVYRKHRKINYKGLTIMKYHPDQRRVKGIHERLQLDTLENLEKGRYVSVHAKIARGYSNMSVWYEIKESILKAVDATLRYPDFIRWIIREHPEDAKRWFPNVKDNVDILISRKRKVEHPSMDLVENIIKADLSWSETNSFFGDDYWSVKRFVGDMISSGYHNRLYKFYLEDTSGVLRKALRDKIKEFEMYHYNGDIRTIYKDLLM